MKKIQLSPTLVEGIERAIAAGAARSVLRRLVSEPVEPPENLAELIEENEPRFVSAAAAEIRPIVDASLYDSFDTADFFVPAGAKKVIAAIGGKCPDAIFPLTVASSGYVREAAVRAIDNIPGPFCLALLNLRSNDWVEPVRHAAMDAVQRAAKTIPPQHVLDCAEVILDIDRFRRGGEGTRSLLLSLFDRPDVRDALFREVLAECHNRTPRLFSLIMRIGLFDDSLPAFASTAKHPQVRRSALRALTAGHHRWAVDGALHTRTIHCETDLDSAARNALNDRSSIVVCIGLQYILDHADAFPDRAEVYKRVLSHPSPAVRERAAYGLRSEGIDVLSEIRAQLSDTPSEKPTLADLLSKHGESEDGAFLFELSTGIAARQRIPFLEGAAKLGQAAAVTELKRCALTEGDIVAAKWASGALHRIDGRPSEIELFEAAADPMDFYARQLDRFLADVPILHQLTLLCKLDCGERPVDWNHIEETLQRRMNRSHGVFNPTAPELTELSDAIAQMQPAAALKAQSTCHNLAIDLTEN